MMRKIIAALCCVCFAAGCAGPREAREPAVTKIAFGSCINTNTHPMLGRFLQQDFDLALMIGDNIYADTTNMTVMKRKYDALKGSPFWRGLTNKAPVYATWDDHDFGANDAGASYPMKRESQQLFLDFMDVPPNSPLRAQEGVYQAYGHRPQIILLDTRYFRSAISTGVHNIMPSGGRYVPTTDTNTTILGEKQWAWLEAQLRKPAEARLIVSSVQFLADHHGGESWANFPHEKQRMLDLIAKTKAKGVFFISGDRHWAELSRMGSLYDFTSSALTQKHPRGTPTPNMHRDVPITYHEANMGLVEIAWERPPKVTFKLLDVNGDVRLEKTFRAR